MPSPSSDARFRLALTPGMTPTSWTRTWADRLPDHPLDLVQLTAAEAPSALIDGSVDAALLRLPVDRDRLHAIPLYTEVTVVVLPKDHLLTALDELSPDDLAEETLLTPADDVLAWTDPPGEPSLLPTPATTADAVELVASGVGVLIVPMSLARLHHRKDLTYRPITDAPTSQTALAWSRSREDDPLIEELIGIVRGRTANSSRGRARTESAPASTPASPAKRPTAGPRTTAAQRPRRKPAPPRRGSSPRRRGR
ncbi:LysR family substrate-binding domain-containing protein [Cellulomonas sp. NPDC089187]|uniref:LysR family substrate-binding domain-containing protein n=1 Tax=Cellulomonas sp. NPDC089187 TaxID=3154970 RepID=UPI003418A81C